jgi:SAM-dependent methyltransferase
MAHVHEFLRSHLVDPQTRTSPASWSNDAVIFDDGSSYAIVDGIPVMLAHTDGATHYREHYATDAQAFDYFEERDAATDHDEHRLRQTVLRQVPPNTASVLDVGCGRAWVARALSVQSSLVCSLDVSITNPRKALQAIPNNNHCAVVADAFALPFADGTFDCVVSSEVIEHVPDPAAFLKELLRVLSIHCNNVTPLHAHLHSFTEHTMQQLSPSTSMSYEIFGNKALLHLRTYVLLRFLPYALWRVVDAIANSLINKCSHIVCVYSKRV